MRHELTDVFPIVPANARARWLIVALVAVVLIAVATVLFLTTRGALH